MPCVKMTLTCYMSTNKFHFPNDDKNTEAQFVEILGAGHQTVIFGVHPCAAEFIWDNNSPASIRPQDS